MAFKMKRSSVSLRSSSRITPITTKRSPFRQDTDGSGRDISINGGDLNISSETAGVPAIEGTDPVLANYEYKPGTDAQESEFEARCGKFNKTNSDAAKEAGCEWPEEGETVITPGTEGTPAVEGETDLGTTSLTQTSQGAGNILSPRELRRNYSMAGSNTNKLGRLKDKANRNIRKAIRKGMAVDPADLKIMSGATTGNLDGINLAKDSSGTRSIYTGVTRGKFLSNKGEGEDKNMVGALNTEAKRLDALYSSTEGDDNYMSNQDLADLARANVEKETGADQYKVESGQFLSDRTRKLMKRKGHDTTRYGKHGMVKKDRNKVNKLNKRLENNDGMSDKRKERIKKRIKRKGGGDSPTKMTVNVTRPSYKMGGFGSK